MNASKTRPPGRTRISNKVTVTRLKAPRAPGPTPAGRGVRHEAELLGDHTTWDPCESSSPARRHHVMDIRPSRGGTRYRPACSAYAWRAAGVVGPDAGNFGQ